MYTQFGPSLAELLEPISFWYARQSVASSLHCHDCPYNVCTDVTTSGLAHKGRHGQTNAYRHSVFEFSLVSMETASMGHTWCT